ncbi:MAG: hypothetical protein J3K34DRAFT_422769 [Monoraphidium minutum]|nr:MAG: hypothetical protein J3K34DRAFT_422769 [Monoraphidium minutum]
MRSLTASARPPPSVADITSSLRSGRVQRWASRQRASARSASRLRSWNSSSSTAPTPASPGSACSRRSRMPSVTTSMRVDALTLLSSRTRYPTVRPTGSRSIDAMRRAAALAATRRGSSTMMRWPPSRNAGACSSSASGTAVVLPAPGGACSTMQLLASSPSRIGSRHSRIGRPSATASASGDAAAAAAPRAAVAPRRRG